MRMRMSALTSCITLSDYKGVMPYKASDLSQFTKCDSSSKTLHHTAMQCSYAPANGYPKN